MINLRYRGWYGHKPFIFKAGPNHKWVAVHPQPGTYEGFEVNGHATHTDAITEVDNRVRVRKIRAIQDGAA